MKKTFIVTVDIAECWITDGFPLETSEITTALQNGLEDRLPYAEQSEITVTVEDAP